MVLVSRDRLTSRMGDPFGSVSARSRFGEGDPFLPAAIMAIQGGIRGVQAIRAARAARAPMSSNLMTRIQPSKSIPGRVIAHAQRMGLAAGRRFVGQNVMTGRRHRRMRVTNVKALRRAFRRVTGFAKIARQTIAFTHRVRMKHRRKRK